MLYIVSDPHGEYELFLKLLEKIKFSADDEMIICGDIIDKGSSSVRLAKLIFSMPNIKCILGNHEYDFLKYYRAILEASPNDFDAVLRQLREYFPYDGYLLDWDTVDRFEALPLYIEKEDIICVHSGVPMNERAELLPLTSATAEQLVYDRRFKNPDVIHRSGKCVFFGHTQTSFICGESKIIGYRRSSTPARAVTDFYKIHLDTGAPTQGVMGCFCVDTLSAIYAVKRA